MTEFETRGLNEIEAMKEFFTIRVSSAEDKKMILRFLDKGDLRIIITSNWDVYLGTDFHNRIIQSLGLDKNELVLEGYVQKHLNGSIGLSLSGHEHFERIDISKDKRDVVESAIKAKVKDFFDNF
ncbi:MAG: hypothetical protein JWO40_746 [Candidatus Doudnabacteria bacterium]|nr:hypothetical protein [Candidatus Doudnabacteria bacterium]